MLDLLGTAASSYEQTNLASWRNTKIWPPWAAGRLPMDPPLHPTKTTEANKVSRHPALGPQSKDQENESRRWRQLKMWCEPIPHKGTPKPKTLYVVVGLSVTTETQGEGWLRAILNGLVGSDFIASHSCTWSLQAGHV